jgi:glycosyltransferase involved in cell wall biosynthesis
VVVHAGWGQDQPLAYLEAAAAGVPVVCSEGDELAEVVGDDEGGFVCPRLDLPALAAAVTALAADPALRHAKGTTASARVVAAYSPSAGAARLCAELSGLSERGR